MRLIWAALGLLALACGIIGVVLPLVPTVPFVLLAAFCFARSSERLHSWLLTHPRFGPAIVDWQTYGAVSPRGKRLATIGCTVVLGLSVTMGLPDHVIAIQAGVLSLVMLFIWTRPNGPR